MMNNIRIVLDNINKIHTTTMGLERIKKNTSIEGDVINYIKSIIHNSIIYRKGKNYYVHFKNYLFTINAYSYTVITAKKIKEKKIEFYPITLKSIDDSSINNLYDIITSENIKKTYMIDDFKTNKEAFEYATFLQTLSYIEDILVFGIYYDETLVGLINKVSKNNKEIEVGYCILPTYQNRGIATKALQIFIDYLFGIGYEKVKASFFEGNIASQKVMEKCHMVYTGKKEKFEYQKEIKTCICYEITKNK